MLQSLTPGAYIGQFADHSPTQLYRVAPDWDAAKKIDNIASSEKTQQRGKKKRIVTEEGARTLDHKVKSLALYQLSYSGPCLGIPSLGCADC